MQLLALTAMRRDEVCGPAWPMVDWRSACFRLPDSMTGKKVVPVSSAVLALLREIHEHHGNPRAGDGRLRPACSSDSPACIGSHRPSP